MASDSGGESLDPISALVLIIILSVLGYAAYDSIYRFLQGEAPPQNAVIVEPLPE